MISRFGVNPKWLIYLPPTMSPPQTTKRPGLLEHPAEAFSYYRQQGIAELVCEEKHMGSRAVVVLGRNEEAIKSRFGITGEGIGTCYTRTGRRFFHDPALEAALLERIHQAVTAAGLWEHLQSDWLCLDCELMPWSAKAQDLVLQQYAAVGAAASASIAQAVQAVATAVARDQAAGDLLGRLRSRAQAVDDYINAYQRYCWPVNSIDDLKLAPFHLLASEGQVHSDKDHLWHMETLAGLSQADPGLLVATPYQLVDLTDEASVAAATAWWEDLTERGGEGMVVKPLSFIAHSPKQGLFQPAVKCRGREYLRIIYGPLYTEPENLERLRARGLSIKRGLALESEAVDPRL